MAEESEVIKKTIWDTQKEAFAELKKALAQEKEDNFLAKEEGTKYTYGRRLGDWAKKFWVVLLIWGIAFVVVWKALTPPPKRSHHGYNSRGERY